MNSWDIYTYDPGFGDHPAVIVSHSQRAANKPVVEILLCSSQRASRKPNPNEVILDSADGLDWETLCKCDLIYSVAREDLHTQRGQVSAVRRRQIIQTIIRTHGWNDL